MSICGILAGPRVAILVVFGRRSRPVLQLLLPTRMPSPLDPDRSKRTAPAATSSDAAARPPCGYSARAWGTTARSDRSNEDEGTMMPFRERNAAACPLDADWSTRRRAIHRCNYPAQSARLLLRKTTALSRSCNYHWSSLGLSM